MPVPATSPSAEIIVRIQKGSTGKGTAAYGANPLTISKGTKITWVNEDDLPHSATSDTQVWDSGVLQTGQRFSRTFNDAGNFPYFCTVHGKASMSGTVVVQ